jgi:hypothetical protein
MGGEGGMEAWVAWVAWVGGRTLAWHGVDNVGGDRKRSGGVDEVELRKIMARLTGRL